MTMEHESDEEQQQEQHEHDVQDEEEGRGEDTRQGAEQTSEEDVQADVKHLKPLQEEEDGMAILDHREVLSHPQSGANTNALLFNKGRVKTLATVEAEFQCIICQDTMFKPMSAVCGHSFCRMCLLDSLLMRSIEEAQCPICRVAVLEPFVAKSSLASIFSINVTLWNLGQLLIPSVAERILAYHEEEEVEFSTRLDQLDAKWKMFTLSERAARYHGDEEQEDVRSSSRWEENHEGHDEYPVLKVENTHDGNLHVSRNIVLDTSDENEDGYVHMRVGIAIVEFPSIFELYNEHQECSVNVIKMEEDEEMADGMPFFMNDDGDDDGFVCSSYYNEISLNVCDEAGNCVMERTRGAQGGVVTFPGLRLDVPGGMDYTFRFSDDLYGLKLSITTRLREPHEISDTPVADFVSLFHDEARDASRRNRDTRHDSDSDHEFDEEESESDDSLFGRDCIDEEHNEQPIGCFSDDDGEDHWKRHSDEEAADEEREQVRARRRQPSERNVQIIEEHQDDDVLSGKEDAPSEHREDEEVDDEFVRPGHRNDRVVESMYFLEDETGQNKHDAVDATKENEDDVRPRQRNANRIVDSDDGDEEEEEERALAESDEEQKASESSGGVQNDHDEDRTEHSNGSASRGITVGGHHNEEDDAVALNPTRKLNRARRFQDDESDAEDNAPCGDAVNIVSERRPRKRSRKVRVIKTRDESDEEQRSNKALYHIEHPYDTEDADEEDDSDVQFRRVQHLFDEEDDDECEDSDDA